MAAFRVSLVCAFLALSACGAQYVTRGADLYADGRYIEAAEVFERTEARLPRCSPSEQARYGLYRGATLLALGDMPHAARWLRFAADRQSANAEALSEDERTMLQQALHVLETQRPAAPPPGNETQAVATQRTLPEVAPEEDVRPAPPDAGN